MKYLIYGILTTAFFGLIFWVATQPSSEVRSLKIGQTWIQTVNVENPFDKTPKNYKRVLDIKEDYVLYILNEKDTLSVKKDSFVFECKIYKPIKKLTK